MTDNYLIRIYANKMENRIMFKIKTEFYLKLLTPETLKLLGSNKLKYWKHFKITKAVLVHCNDVSNYH